MGRAPTAPKDRRGRKGAHRVGYAPNRRVSRECIALDYNPKALGPAERFHHAIGACVLCLNEGSPLASAFQRAARSAEVTEKTMKKWFMDWHTEGWHIDADGKPKRGPRPRLSAKAQAALTSELSAGPAGQSVRKAACRAVGAGSLDASALDVSDETLRRAARKKMDWEPLKVRKQITAQQAKKRVAFARWLQRVKAMVDRLFFTDSKYFKFDVTNRSTVMSWTLRDEPKRKLNQVQAGDCVIHGYAGACSRGITPLYFATGTHGRTHENGRGKQCRGVCWKEYLNDVLPFLDKEAQALFGNFIRQMIFQQDSASPHTALAVRQWLDERFGPEGHLGPKSTEGQPGRSWPPNSADLSLIEHVWARVEQLLNAWKHKWCTDNPSKQRPTFKEFEEVVKAKFEEVRNDKKFIQALFKSYRRRLQDCVETKGEQRVR